MAPLTPTQSPTNPKSKTKLQNPYHITLTALASARGFVATTQFKKQNSILEFPSGGTKCITQKTSISPSQPSHPPVIPPTHLNSTPSSPTPQMANLPRTTYHCHLITSNSSPITTPHPPTPSKLLTSPPILLTSYVPSQMLFFVATPSHPPYSKASSSSPPNLAKILQSSPTDVKSLSYQNLASLSPASSHTALNSSSTTTPTSCHRCNEPTPWTVTTNNASTYLLISANTTTPPSNPTPNSSSPPTTSFKHTTVSKNTPSKPLHNASTGHQNSPTSSSPSSKMPKAVFAQLLDPPHYLTSLPQSDKVIPSLPSSSSFSLILSTAALQITPSFPTPPTVTN
mgnify:CR=1 FL=1